MVAPVLGIDPYQDAAPIDNAVELHFFQSSADGARVSARVVIWNRCVRSSEDVPARVRKVADIAVLELDDSALERLSSANLDVAVTPASFQDRADHPRETSFVTWGPVSGGVLVEGWLQPFITVGIGRTVAITAPETQKIVPGFSGAPAINSRSGEVLGMFVRANESARQSMVISVQTLAEALASIITTSRTTMPGSRPLSLLRRAVPSLDRDYLYALKDREEVVIAVKRAVRPDTGNKLAGQLVVLVADADTSDCADGLRHRISFELAAEWRQGALLSILPLTLPDRNWGGQEERIQRHTQEVSQEAGLPATNEKSLTTATHMFDGLHLFEVDLRERRDVQLLIAILDRWASASSAQPRSRPQPFFCLISTASKCGDRARRNFMAAAVRRSSQLQMHDLGPLNSVGLTHLRAWSRSANAHLRRPIPEPGLIQKRAEELIYTPGTQNMSMLEWFNALTLNASTILPSEEY
ncbi:hypothetical protein [Belnapia sp. F-4-1]|uniref:hypothetical protein n=1 Tax=Belnapia sp. F-4-1 TaxID=1545443 RepID=UPI00351008BA